MMDPVAYVVGAQNNRLIEVLLSNYNIYNMQL